MSLFAKKTCCRCGKESRLMSSFQSQSGTVHLCSKCQEALHVEGYISYALYVLRKNATYEELMAYSAYYDSVIAEAGQFRDCDFPAEMVESADMIRQLFAQEFKDGQLNKSLSLGNYRYNASFLASYQFKDLILRRNEIDLIAVSTDFKSTNKHKDSGLDFVTCMLFANNTVVPYLPTLFVQKSGLFDLFKTRAKQSSISAMSVFYPGTLIADAKDLRKQLRTGVYVPKFDKKAFADALSHVELNSGCCKGDTLLRDLETYKRQATQLNLDLGFQVPKSEQ